MRSFASIRQLHHRRGTVNKVEIICSLFEFHHSFDRNDGVILSMKNKTTTHSRITLRVFVALCVLSKRFCSTHTHDSNSEANCLVNRVEKYVSFFHGFTVAFVGCVLQSLRTNWRISQMKPFIFAKILFALRFNRLHSGKDTVKYRVNKIAWCDSDWKFINEIRSSYDPHFAPLFVTISYCQLVLSPNFFFAKHTSGHEHRN